MSKLSDLWKNDPNVTPDSQWWNHLVDQSLTVATNDAYHRCVVELNDAFVYSAIAAEEQRVGYRLAAPHYFEALIHAEMMTETFEQVDPNRAPRGSEIFDYESLRDAIESVTTALESRIESQFARDEICEYFPELSEKLEKFKQNLPIKEFHQIKAEIMAQDSEGNFINIFPVKGELDDKYVDEVLSAAKALEKSSGEGYKFFQKPVLT